MKKLIFFLLLLTVRPSHAIAQEMAALYSFAIGGATGIITLACNYDSHYLGPRDKLFLAGLSVTSGIAAGGLTYLLLNEMTPKRRFERGLAVIKSLETYDIATHVFAENQLLSKLRDEYYESDLWLIAACSKLQIQVSRLKDAIWLLNAVIQSNDGLFSSQASQTIKQAERMFENLRRAVVTIKESKEYLKQYELNQQQIIQQQKINLQKEQINMQYHAKYRH